MVTEKFHKALGALTSLGDPVRRRLYETVASEGRAVSRNELAKITSVARPLVAYHLERLVKDGLLAARFERQTGKSGPGAGRPAKLYFRPRTAVQVALPPRDYELAARVLAEAIARTPDEQKQRVLNDVAREMGRKYAQDRASHVSGDQAAETLLMESGYEPKRDEKGVTWLRNCVFEQLANDQRELICGMNLSLVQGMLEALPGVNLTARLQPGDDRCCVALTAALPAQAD